MAVRARPRACRKSQGCWPNTGGRSTCASPAMSGPAIPSACWLTMPRCAQRDLHGAFHPCRESPIMYDGSGIAPVAEREQPRRVAFTFISRRRWVGGYNYQLNLFAALARHYPGRIVPVVFAGTGDSEAELAPLSNISGVEVVQSEAFKSFDKRSEGVAAPLLTGIDRSATNAFRTSGIEVVFEVARFFGWRLPIPVLAWFPDFQHQRLPGLFSPAVRWRRDLGFRVQIASRRSILLSSE